MKFPIGGKAYFFARAREPHIAAESGTIPAPTVIVRMEEAVFFGAHSLPPCPENPVYGGILL